MAVDISKLSASASAYLFVCVCVNVYLVTSIPFPLNNRPANQAAALVRQYVQHQQRSQPLQLGQCQGRRGQEEEEEELGE